MLRAIREIQPRWVVGENVLGLVNWNGGLVFDEVQADLENEGYVVQPYVLPACAVNAPHRRDRVWFVAHCDRNGQHGSDCEHEIDPSQRGIDAQRDFEPIRGDATNAGGLRCGGSAETTRHDNPIAGRKLVSDIGHNGNQVWSEVAGCGTTTSNSNGIGLSCEGRPTGMGWERLGINNAQDNRSGWKNFPTQSPICGGDDGLPTELDGITFSRWRQESVKAYGNAIVPQVAHQIFKAIEQYECQAFPNP